jgi:ketosteroid isomerase-like protein
MRKLFLFPAITVVMLFPIEHFSSSALTLREDAAHHSANTIADTPGDAIMSNLTSQDSDAEATLAAVERFNEAFNRHDVDAVMAAMTDDCVFENTSPFPDGTRIEGQSAVRAYWESFFKGSPTAHFDAEDVIVSKDRCIVRWKYTKTKDGKPWHIRGVDVFRVRGGKISEKLSYVKG